MRSLHEVSGIVQSVMDNKFSSGVVILRGILRIEKPLTFLPNFHPDLLIGLEDIHYIAFSIKEGGELRGYTSIVGFNEGNIRFPYTVDGYRLYQVAIS